MINRVRTWLNRPLAEDFSFKNQSTLSVQAGIYVFLFLTVFNAGWADWQSRLWMHVLFAIGCVFSSVLANAAIPRLFPVLYDEDRWTVGRHIVHVLVVLLIISIGNQLIVWSLKLPAPSFLTMYGMVTAIGFFPIFMGVMVAERRRLKRNLAQASQLNKQLNELHQPNVPDTANVPELPRGILLTSDTGKERLSLLPNQLIYVESVGNYVEVHWLNFMFPQKTVLRSTLKDVEAAVAHDPQFFRCHRAFLVNLRAVNHTTGNSRGYQLTMSGSNREIPVSRSYLVSFDERMAQLV
ncbi:LytR/AlgR family response regulator transcription factor [Fibrella forsythiae]|uniref:LytTR family transcriptional regulator n=1 Tax=Fibrella forsythiae TaxID=2817061 RepID=A0ABS3JDU9_9BACT|nr:LytTR family DNA-binding domain-containing protein [Fibrella forsythiae]MBO0947623.1 LytTR family transcriptional regulator [Fibrella forsythiae]